MSYGFASAFLGVSALLAVGCSRPTGDAVDSSEAAETSAVTVHFGSHIDVSGNLERGTRVEIAYDADRLATCRGDQGGVPQWSITGYYRLAGGDVRSFTAAGLGATSTLPSFTLDRAGDLEMWFENTSRWGCDAFDSDFGRNFHFAVSPAAGDPGWLGNARYAINRETCGNGPCESDLHDATADIVYDTYARQRAAVAVLTFEAWKGGVTDFDNADLWKELDVEVHSRVAGTTDFTTAYVSFAGRQGNNARYALDLRSLDALASGSALTAASQCPAYPIATVPDSSGAYVEADVELYFTVNGVDLRPANAAGLFEIRYENYAGLYAPCLTPPRP